MTKRLKTVPAHAWLIDKQEHHPSSELEAMMMHDDDWQPRDESLWDAVDAVLTPDERTVVDLIVLGGWSFREVAAEMKCSVGWVHALKVKAFKKLAEALSERVRNGSDEE